MIKRGSRLFVEVKRIGEVDDKGKGVLGLGYKGKQIAAADEPLAVVVWLLTQVCPLLQYSSAKARDKDLARFKRIVAKMSYANTKQRVRQPEKAKAPARRSAPRARAATREQR